MTLSVWLSDWLTLREAELKPRTIESYKDLLDRYIFPTIGSQELDALKPDDIRHMLADVARSGKSRTAELIYAMLRCALSDAETLDANPMLKVKRPRHHQTTPLPWSDDEMTTYMAALADHPHGLALSLALVLGLRRGEICGLRWRDVDWSSGSVHIVNQRIRLATGKLIDCSPKSASSIRTIPLPAPLLANLKAARGLPDAYVTRLTPSGLDSAHRRLVARLDLPSIPLHGLRHTMATSCIRHGGQMRCLQSILGHSSLTVTANKYTHPDQSMLQSALDAATIPCYTVLQT